MTNKVIGLIDGQNKLVMPDIIDIYAEHSLIGVVFSDDLSFTEKEALERLGWSEIEKHTWEKWV
jgi:predicted AAA+ superfamily ATPase